MLNKIFALKQHVRQDLYLSFSLSTSIKHRVVVAKVDLETIFFYFQF